MMKKKIVVVGCGFAGLPFIKTLKKDAYDILLIDKAISLPVSSSTLVTICLHLFKFKNSIKETYSFNIMFSYFHSLLCFNCVI